MTDPRGQATTQIKLRVNTAAEAVSVLRERYGDQARVLAVKQVEAGGLKRLISKPQLEVIVEVPADPKPKAQGADAKASEPTDKPAKSAAPKASKAQTSAVAEEKSATAREDAAAAEPTPEQPEKRSSNAVGNLYRKGAAVGASSYFGGLSEEESESARQEARPDESPEAEPRLGTAANPVRRGTLEAVRRAISMLESIGFDRSLIERIRAEVDFKNIGSLPAMDLYARICDWLGNHFPTGGSRPLGPSRAFIGCSGVGKTAALCKTLSADVFVRGLAPTILKVDSELPNPSDALEIFCEIMGAPLARDAEEIETITAARPLLVDMPGFSLSDATTRRACRETLDELDIEERILVVNAAYEAELIADMLAAGDELGANRVVFSHLDETRRPGKLWKFLLNGRITPLFFSIGPNPAGEYALETRSYLLERTFPNGREVAAASRGQRRRPESERREEASLRS